MIDISVITINYNDAVGLTKTIASVRMQQNVSFEYIVIDGLSTDDSVDVIKANSVFIDYWQSEKDAGIYNAMNIGAKKAKGKYVLFLNSGDTFNNENALYFLSKNIVAEQKDIYYGNLNVIGSQNFIKKYPALLSFNYFVNDTLPFPCSLIKKSVIEELGFFDESFKIVSDWKFFMIAICKFNKSYQYIDGLPIVNFALDGVSSTHPELVNQERCEILNASFSANMIDYENLQILTNKLYNYERSFFMRILRKLKII